MKRFFSLLSAALLLLSCSVLPGAPLLDLQEVLSVRGTLDAAMFPDADVVLLADYEQVTYRKDATGGTTDEYFYWIVTDKGRERFRTLEFHFNSFYEKPRLELVEIVRPDGSRVKPEIQRKTVTEPGQTASNIFDPANKVLQVGIPGLRVGDILHVIYGCDTVKPRMRGIWCGMAVLQADCPVISYRYEVIAPSDCPLAAISVKDEVPGTLRENVIREGKIIRYIWQAEQVPQIHPEPGMPPWYLHTMRILVSTAPDWGAVSRWYDALCRKHIEKTSPELLRKSRELAAGCKSEAETIRAIFNFVATQIRYAGITREDEAPGYEPHDVDLTFQQRYGVCRDKAALLVAMLRAAGLRAYPVLFMAGNPKDPEVPNNYFNHAVVAVKSASGEYILMDPTDENTTELLPAYAMNRSYLAATPEGDKLRRTPEIPAEKNMLMIRSQGEVGGDGALRLRSTLEFGGINDNIYRGAFARWPREYLEQFLASALKKVLPGAELLQWRIFPADLRDLREPLKLELTVAVAGYVNILWGDGVVVPPLLGGGFGALHFLLGDTGLEKRRYPLETDSTAGIAEEFTLRLPENLTAAALPEAAGSNEGALHFSCSFQRDGALVKGSQSLKLARSSIVPSEYPLLKQTLRELENNRRRRIVVRRDFSGDPVRKFPHARSILEENRVDLAVSASDRSVMTCYQRRRILNYGGVKAFSELRIPFHPAWETARLLEGTVTLPDGSVRPVDPASVMVMDLPGASAAPRYTGAKVMVVSLPGVEPGCVVETSWQIAGRGGEALNRSWTMTGEEPVMRTSITFSCPEKERKNAAVITPGAGFAVHESRQDGKTVREISGVCLPERNVEPGAPPAWCYAPRCGLSFFQYGDFAEKLRRRLTELSREQPEAAALARELTARTDDPVERLRMVRDFVDKEIREAGPELNRMLLKELSPADLTLREKYGNSADRAILLLAMLNALEIPAEPVAVTGIVSLPETMAALTELPEDHFTGVLVRAIPADGVEIYLNDTGRYDRLGTVAHDGKIGLNLGNGELITISGAAEYRDSIVREYGIVCAADGSAEITLQADYYGGLYGALHRELAQMTPELKSRFFQNLASSVAEGAEIVDKSAEFSGYPGRIFIKLKVRDFVARNGDFLMLAVPDGGIGELLHSAGKRTVPYWLSRGIDREYRYTVELAATPDAYELTGENWRWDAPGEGGWIGSRSRIDGRTVVMERQVKLTPFYLSAAEYPVVAAAQRLLSSAAAGVILVKVTGK